MKYEGILKGYPRIRERFGRIADYIALCRPFTLLAPVFAGFFGILIQLAADNQLSLFFSEWHTIVFVSITLLIAQASGQVFNNACDVEIDRIMKPYRPIPKGRVTEQEAMGFGIILLIIAFARSFTINITFGILMTLILLFAVFYNVPPVRFKRFFLVNLLGMSVSRGLLPFLAVWSVFGSVWDLKPWILGTFATLWVFNWQATKDIPDIEGDMLYDINTFPVKIGLQNTRKFMKLFSPVPFVSLFLFIYSGLLEAGYVLLFSLVVVSILNIRFLERFAYVTENTLSWVFFYVGLGLIYVLSFVVEVI